MTHTACVLAILMAGCGGIYEPIDERAAGGAGGGGEDSGDAMVRTLFEQMAAPAMARSTCNSCHLVAPNPVFGPTYDSLVAYMDGRILNCTLPEMSLLVSIGQHTGPPFLSGDQTSVEEWLVDWATMSSRCNP